MSSLQRNFLGQTSASVCEDFPTYREQTPSLYSGCNRDGASSRNVGNPSHPDAAVCSRKKSLNSVAAKASRLMSSLVLLHLVLLKYKMGQYFLQRVHTNTQTDMYVCMYVYICMNVRMYVCMYVCVCVSVLDRIGNLKIQIDF